MYHNSSLWDALPGHLLTGVVGVTVGFYLSTLWNQRPAFSEEEGDYAGRRRKGGRPAAAANGKPSRRKPSEDDEDDQDGGDDNDEDEAGEDEEADENEDEVSEDCKLVLVIRNDLPMTKGKVAAQCSHATLAAYKQAVRTHQKLLRFWERNGQPKITLKCNSEEEMLELQAIALSLGLIAKTIQDAGRTQIDPGSLTVLAVGPGKDAVVLHDELAVFDY